MLLESFKPRSQDRESRPVIESTEDPRSPSTGPSSSEIEREPFIEICESSLNTTCMVLIDSYLDY